MPGRPRIRTRPAIPPCASSRRRDVQRLRLVPRAPRRSDRQFAPHESFDDHFWLTMVDDTDSFYPDGQIRDEDFEFTAFRAAGCTRRDALRAVPRTAHAQAALGGNYLCMLCHVSGVSNNMPQVDLATHSHHKANDRGDLCTGCHMPQTVYMQRHSGTITVSRFPIRCSRRSSASRTPAIAVTPSAPPIGRWNTSRNGMAPAHGAAYRWRAQTVARAKAGDRGAVEGLLRCPAATRISIGARSRRTCSGPGSRRRKCKVPW